MKTVTDEEFELLKGAKNKIKTEGEYCSKKCFYIDIDTTSCFLLRYKFYLEIEHNKEYGKSCKTFRCDKCKELIK